MEGNIAMRRPVSDSVLPVCALQRGQQGAVVSVGVKDPKLTRQLTQLGIAPGSLLNVIRNDPPYLIFRVNEREIVINDAVSEKILTIVQETYRN